LGLYYENTKSAGGSNVQYLKRPKKVGYGVMAKEWKFPKWTMDNGIPFMQVDISMEIFHLQVSKVEISIP